MFFSRSDLAHSGDRVRGSQHRGACFRLGAGSPAVHAAADRGSRSVAPVRLLVPASADGRANLCATIAAAGSIAAAKWFSWLALAVLALLVVEEVRRRCGSRPLGLFAGAAVLSCPLLAGLAQSLYVDHVLTLLCTAGFVLLFRAEPAEVLWCSRPGCSGRRDACTTSHALPARRPPLGGDHGLHGASEVHRLDLLHGMGAILGRRFIAEMRRARRPAMVGVGRRVASGGGLALVRVRLRGHGKSVLSVSEQLVSVALLG